MEIFIFPVLLIDPHNGSKLKCGLADIFYQHRELWILRTERRVCSGLFYAIFQKFNSHH